MAREIRKQELRGMHDIACDSLDRDGGECDCNMSTIEKLQAFKKYVHDRLDAAGINKYEEQNAINGCRIGSRLDDVLRISETPAQCSELRPGVGKAVESETADEKGLASRVEELEEALKPLIEIAKGYRVIGYDHKFLRAAIAAGERALAGKKEK